MYSFIHPTVCFVAILLHHEAEKVQISASEDYPVSEETGDHVMSSKF